MNWKHNFAQRQTGLASLPGYSYCTLKTCWIVLHLKCNFCCFSLATLDSFILFPTFESWWPTSVGLCTQSLGVQVDETLSWEAHISEVVSKVAKVLAALRRLRPICPQSILVTIYKSLILPHLDYCSAVWGCIGNGLSQKLQKLQNRAARIITGSGWDIRSVQILRVLNWESLADRRAKQLKSLMFKTVNNFAPEYLCDKFTSVNAVHRQSSERST